MPLTLVVFAGFYPAARHAERYADTLAQALHGPLVLLHVNRAALYDPYKIVGERYRQDELATETDTTAALHRQAAALRTPATVLVTTDLLPEVARDVAARHHPALFVLSQPDPARPAASVVADCAELLRAGQHALLVVPAGAPADQPPRRVLIAADREPFALAPAAGALRDLLARPGTALVVAHVSDGVEDDTGCAAALRAVQASGLVDGLPIPELRGYARDDYEAGVLAAVQDTQADLVVVFARQRSYWGELFHRSVTARLLADCPVPVLVLPTAAEVRPAPGPPDHTATAAQYASGLLAGLAPAA
ncbi:universal stress protein [Hymenobacter caeli]|uniref:Nucleotide-binding universal stress UspA family protein n=1 Tax=Hymenobacter caeli TaxID=2735894 RepID=A0ABX2FST5_9BACT|nr:universal stress protein [Hymenobacter caeli]NRT20189.1 nucleotide-binding universal stress UspA family protein [Hymenobacter caeli]